MKTNYRNSYLITLTSTITYLVLIWGILPIELLQAQRTKVPELPSPPKTAPSTRRGDKCSEKDPQALVLPSDQAISTAAIYPTFLFFIPPNTKASKAEFVLKDDKKQSIYRTTLSLPKQSGILRLTLPNDQSVNKLAINQTYRWEFKTICSAKDDDNNLALGDLQRLPKPDDFQSQLSQASLQEQLSRYRSEGLEYDALLVLDALRRENPKDTAIQAEWEKVLDKYELGDFKKLPPIN